MSDVRANPSITSVPSIAPVLRDGSNPRFWDGVAFVAPALLFLQLEVGGRLSISELMFLALLPLLLFRRGELLLASLPRQFLLFGLFWLYGQVITDVIRHTPFDDYSRGLSKILWTMIDFMMLYLLLAGNRRRLLLFTIGLAIGTLLSVWRHSDEISSEDSWKFGKGMGVTMIVILLTLIPRLARIPFLQSTAVAAMGVLALAMGSRNLCGCCLLAAAYLAMQYWMSRHNPRRRLPTIQNQIVLLLTVVTIVPAILSGYSYAASSGLLGEKARMKYQLQSRGGNILLGGRGEIRVSIQAIQDLPIIGHGSWAKDLHYVDLLTQNLRDSGMLKDMDTTYQRGLIPTHSHFFGGWVEAGILGGLFWLYTIWFTLRVLGRFYMTHEPLSPLIVFFAINFLWDVMFSPFGNDRRVTVPFVMILLMFASEMATRAANTGLPANIRPQINIRPHNSLSAKQEVSV